MKESKYYLVDKEVLPKVFLKVVEAKSLLDKGLVSNVSQAVKQTGISRSTYYKYHQSVRPFFGNNVMTLGLRLTDDKGALKGVLEILAAYDLSVLTINQTIPVNHIASVTMSIEALSPTLNLQSLLDDLREFTSVRSVEVLARE